MCGIAGYLLKRPVGNVYRDPGIILETLRKRGPDDEGACLISRKDKRIKLYRTDKTSAGSNQNLSTINDKASVISHDIAFFHTRYSIIDLSEKGHQPFQSSDGNIVGIFNGELYNYIELRDELSSCGVQFKTNSDTEVLVEGYNYWGERLWSRMNGFWAFCLFDLKDNILVMSRDRIGVAPLYYLETREALFFSSYIETLLSVSEGKKYPDDDIIMGFAQTGIKDHNNSTFYSNIKSIPSASIVKFSGEEYSLRQAKVKTYWSVPENRIEEKDLSFKNAIDEFRDIFFSSIQLRMRADVKIAFELSGGLDSSSIVVAAAQISDRKISTYTAKVKGADEEPFARSMLKKYDIDYNVISDIEDDFARDYGSFSRLMEEPYDNPNDYTHNRMLQLIKDKGVHVIITGAGGDEVFAGYEASFWPKAYRELKINGGRDYLRADWYEFCRRFKTVKSTADILRHYCLDPFNYLLNKINSTGDCQRNITKTSALLFKNKYNKMSFDESAQFHFNTAMIPYYVRSSDHFTMGIPIEHRFPFLDYRMVEFGLKLPITYLFRNGWTKYIVRKAMEPYLPKKILWRRKKMGFTFPYRKYFKANLSIFKPILQDFQDREPAMKTFGSYEALLKKDPALLWRLLSLSIWTNFNLNKQEIV